MVKPVISSFNTLGELLIQKYERYLPTAFDESMTLLQKVNKVIDYLNQVGKATDGLIETWNAVSEWIMNEGLAEDVSAKLDEMATDGTLDNLINQVIFGDLTVRLDGVVSENDTYSAKQVKNMSRFMNKMINNEPLTIVCQGDSLTNGQDTGSVDKRAYTADSTFVTGASTDTDIAAYTYPEVLRASMNEKGNVTTVFKRGRNGDTAQLSYDRWTTNPNADLHLIQLGTNDSWLSHDIVANFDVYFKLVKRILDWGSAVVILTPPKKSGYAHWQGVYSEMLKELGERISVPVIDTTQFFDGYYSADIYGTDGVHFNGKGYYLLGAKVASMLTGVATLVDPIRISSGKHLTVDPNYNHWASRGSVSFSGDPASPLGVGYAKNEGIVAVIQGNSQLSLGFYAEEDDLILVPQFLGTTGMQCFIETNYRCDMAAPVNSLADGKTTKAANVIPENNKIYYQLNQTQILDPDFMSDAQWNSIRLTSRGYNSIQIKNNTASGQINFYGFVVISLKDYLTSRLIKTTNNSIEIGNDTKDIVNLISGENVFVHATLAPNTDVARDIGATWAKWQKGYFSGFVSTGSFSTANRPSYTDYQAGAMIFDTTLNKPIFRNAANDGWVDAAGTSV